MRKQLISFVILVALFLCGYPLKAQVTNYSVLFAGNSSITVEPITELTGLSSYTVQFWMNPSAWHIGATIYATGSENAVFSAALGSTSGELVFKIGSDAVKITDSSIAINQWAQVTFINDEGNVKVLINNIPITPDVTSIPTVVPAMTSDFEIGGHGYEGRIDEFRLWGTPLDSEYILYNNTLNKFHPQWDKLIVYYKFDQDLCPNVVDYKFTHHGSFTGGASREAVTDNANFVYRKAIAYASFGRWADRYIDRDKYLLANEILLLNVGINQDGTINLNAPDNSGTITNGNYLTEYEGRPGVLSLNGTGAEMKVGSGALRPGTNDYYSFQTWIYLNEWTEGAYIFKKEAESDTRGFSIRLGEAGTKSLIVRLNGADYRKDYALATGQWIFLGVTLFEKNPRQDNIYKTFMFTVNDKSTFPLDKDCPPTVPSTTSPYGVFNTDAYVGINLNGKLDNTAIYHKTYDATSIKVLKEAPYVTPDFTTRLNAYDPFSLCNSLWKYDMEENVGFDTYSHTNYINIMKSAAKNYRGQRYVLSVYGYGESKSMLANAEGRTKLAESLVKVALLYDGLDFDFEWPSGTEEWNNYGMFIRELRKALTKVDPEKKKTISVSLHNISRNFPREYQQYVDEFLFQQYGPAAVRFTMPDFLEHSNSILQNFDPEKVVLSFAATTSRGTNGITTTEMTTGVLNFLDDPAYTPDMNEMKAKDGFTYSFTGVNQTKDRCRYVVENNAGGIFYWDMGNDIPTSHANSLVKHASYIINSNVDTLVVDIHASSLNKSEKLVESKKAILVPNPVKDDVSILLPSNAALKGLDVFDMSGRLVLSEDSFRGNRINVSSLRAGVYTLRITDLEGNVYISKLSRNK